jgi:hypothetical protein
MKLVFSKPKPTNDMGLFDNIKHTEEDKFELTTVEKYLYLPYYCFIDDGYNGREIGVFFDVYSTFFDGDFDYEYYIDKLMSKHLLHGDGENNALLDYCVAGINSDHYTKLFIFLVEGVFADGHVDKAEKKKIETLAEKLKVDKETATKIVEVSMLKYT